MKSLDAWKQGGEECFSPYPHPSGVVLQVECFSPLHPKLLQEAPYPLYNTTTIHDAATPLLHSIS